MFGLLAALVTFAVLVLLLLIARKAIALLVNVALGLALLFAANVLISMGITYTWLTVLVCAIGGNRGRWWWSASTCWASPFRPVGKSPPRRTE